MYRPADALVALVGAPGCGKTALARALCAAGGVSVESSASPKYDLRPLGSEHGGRLHAVELSATSAAQRHASRWALLADAAVLVVDARRAAVDAVCRGRLTVERQPPHISAYMSGDVWSKATVCMARELAFLCAPAALATGRLVVVLTHARDPAALPVARVRERLAPMLAAALDASVDVVVRAVELGEWSVPDDAPGGAAARRSAAAAGATGAAGAAGAADDTIYDADGARVVLSDVRGALSSTRRGFDPSDPLRFVSLGGLHMDVPNAPPKDPVAMSAGMRVLMLARVLSGTLDVGDLVVRVPGGSVLQVVGMRHFPAVDAVRAAHAGQLVTVELVVQCVRVVGLNPASARVNSFDDVKRITISAGSVFGRLDASAPLLTVRVRAIARTVGFVNRALNTALGLAADGTRSSAVQAAEEYDMTNVPGLMLATAVGGVQANVLSARVLDTARLGDAVRNSAGGGGGGGAVGADSSGTPYDSMQVTEFEFCADIDSATACHMSALRTLTRSSSSASLSSASSADSTGSGASAPWSASHPFARHRRGLVPELANAFVVVSGKCVGRAVITSALQSSVTNLGELFVYQPLQHRWLLQEFPVRDAASYAALWHGKLTHGLAKPTLRERYTASAAREREYEKARGHTVVVASKAQRTSLASVVRTVLLARARSDDLASLPDELIMHILVLLSVL